MSSVVVWFDSVQCQCQCSARNSVNCYKTTSDSEFSKPSLSSRQDLHEIIALLVGLYPINHNFIQKLNMETKPLVENLGHMPLTHGIYIQHHLHQQWKLNWYLELNTSLIFINNVYTAKREKLWHYVQKPTNATNIRPVRNQTKRRNISTKWLDNISLC